MLEVFVKFICFIIMSITGFYIVKTVTKSDVKLITSRSIILLMILALIQLMLYKVQYTISYTLIAFLLNIIIYKSIFKLTLEDSIISSGIYTIILFFSDAIVSTFFRTFCTLEQIRTEPIISIIVNLSTSLLSLLITEIKMITRKIEEFYRNTKTKQKTANIAFLTLLIITLCYLGYYATIYNGLDFTYILSVIIMVLLAILTYIFIKNKNSYNQLSDEYDTLFSYVQNFEDWIEKEQLNRHEYKNQLAVLRCLTTEKKVKDKIDEILEDNIEIEGEIVRKLKEIPTGGLKGLMYYKAAIAQKSKIKLMVDVSLQRKTLLNCLTEEQIKTLCKLVGIYFDNAIEAAQETKKKDVLLEIYEFKDKVTIVISNSYKRTRDFKNRNERGVTTKGEGRGNGLYFANNLIDKNKWITSKQEEIDNYYIQTLIIKN